MQTVTHRVPATSANLGPGYDCLGVALRIYNRVTVRRLDPRQAAALAADPAAPGHLSPMMREAAEGFFEVAQELGPGIEPFDFSCQITGDVPRSRGLGSSVTVRLGLLHGLNELCRQPLGREELFLLCAELEGHPDNAAPAEFGGFTVASEDGCIEFEVAPQLAFVLLIPELEIATPDARKALPERLAHADAVASAANAARITAAFASGQYEALRGAFADGLHQPFRTPLIPFLPAVITAAEGAGALGGYLSGSGSAIAALTLEDPQRVAAAMQRAAEKAGVAAKTVITSADKAGIKKVAQK